jgi:ribosomal protein S4
MKSLPDYKDILSGRSLKKFIKETEGKYKLVEHPYQKAKVALIPKNESYKFPELDEKQEQSVIINRNAEKALIEFLKALKKLPEQDQEKVQIPVSVLVKMLK